MHHELVGELSPERRAELAEPRAEADESAGIRARRAPPATAGAS